MTLRVSEAGLSLIKQFEGQRLKLYNCPAGHCSVGWGHLVHKGPCDGSASEQTFINGITEEGAQLLLAGDVCYKAEIFVRQLVKVPLTQNQYDALVSFVYNVGPDIDADTIPEGLGDSTLLKKLNAGDYAGAADEFLHWNHANGKVLAGLTRRREAERALFLS